MRKGFICILVAATFATGCMKEDDICDDVTYVSRTYGIEIGDDTKTSVAQGGKVSWNKGDVIRYYSKANGTVGECTVPADGTKTNLTMSVAEGATFLVAEYGGESVSSNTSGNTFVLNGAVKAEQSGKFEDAHVSVVKTYDVSAPSLTFSNVTSVVKFSLERTDVAYITFESNDGTAIHGDGVLKFTFAETTPTVSLGTTTGSKIKVAVGAAGTYYLSMLPMSLPTGFTIRCYDASNVCLGGARSEKEFILAKNSLLNLGVLDSRLHDLDKPTIIYNQNLSEKGTANCYIVPVEGEYYFDATVKGSSSELIDGTAVKAEVLWESFGTDVAPSVGDIVKDAKYSNGKVTFTATGNNGNAVIAIENRDDEILWSWHIWCCMGYDADFYAQAYNNNAGTMMDRNLGATSATPGTVGALGLMYQWGRKDPFLSSSSISSSTVAKSTVIWPSSVYSDASTGTMAYSVANPTVFIKSNCYNQEWYYSGDTSTDNTRWQPSSTSKGTHDPCPTGYRVPDGGYLGIWSTGLGVGYGWTTLSNWNSTSKGMDFGSIDNPVGFGNIWYPAAGYIFIGDGALNDTGDVGVYWSSSTYNYYAYYMDITSEGYVGPSDYCTRAFGCSVRCCKDTNNGPEVVDLGLSVSWATCNLGASKPEEYGDYFAWGETGTKSDYSYPTYKWWNGSAALTKYSVFRSSGIVDNKTVLDEEDDVANVKLGGLYRMPTDSEWSELMNSCTWSWTQRNGVSGYEVRSNINDKQIFLPASGYWSGSTFSDAVSGCYWSSSLYTDVLGDAYSVTFNASDFLRTGTDRCYGLSVRPVCDNL